MPGKIFINETADKQKVELTTGDDGITGGYYDAAGEWHEFGGGSSINPSLSVNVTNTGEPIIGVMGGYVEENGNLYFREDDIPNGESQFEYLIVGAIDELTQEYIFVTALTFETEPTVEEYENCTYTGEQTELFYDLAIVITDPSKPASISLTI